MLVASVLVMPLRAVTLSSRLGGRRRPRRPGSARSAAPRPGSAAASRERIVVRAIGVGAGLRGGLGGGGARPPGAAPRLGGRRGSTGSGLLGRRRRRPCRPGGRPRGSATRPCRPSSCRRCTARTSRRRAIRWLRIRQFPSSDPDPVTWLDTAESPTFMLVLIVLPQLNRLQPDVSRAVTASPLHRKLRTFCAASSVEDMEFYGRAADVDLTYSDVFLVPRRSDITSRLDVDLAPGDGTGATIPIVSANMNSVTGARWPRRSPGAAGSACCRRTCRCRSWCRDPLGQGSRSLDTPVLRDDGRGDRCARPAGSGRDRATIEMPASRRPASARAARRRSATARDGIHRRRRVESARSVRSRRGVDRAGAAPGFDRHARTSALRATLYAPAVDASGRLQRRRRGRHQRRRRAKARALAAAGVDVLVIDTAHGHQEGMLRALAPVEDLGLGIPIAAGNIVTAEGVHDLVAAGADILKVGVGPGAMCTTRMMTAVGRPQFSAVLETAEAARELGAHVWADGGVRYPRDVALALAAGAASVMIGSWFAGTIEAPGELRDRRAGPLVQGELGHGVDEGRARPVRRPRPVRARAQGAVRRGHLVLEDLPRPAAPGARGPARHDHRRACAPRSPTPAQPTSPEFQERARVGLQSAAGYEEGKALPVTW